MRPVRRHYRRASKKKIDRKTRINRWTFSPKGTERKHVWRCVYMREMSDIAHLRVAWLRSLKILNSEIISGPRLEVWKRKVEFYKNEYRGRLEYLRNESAWPNKEKGSMNV